MLHELLTPIPGPEWFNLGEGKRGVAGACLTYNHNGCMASITLKSIPTSVHRALKSRAKSHKRSLNREVMAMIDEVLAPSRKVDIEAMLERERRFRDSLDFTMTPAEIEGALQEGRRI